MIDLLKDIIESAPEEQQYNNIKQLIERVMSKKQQSKMIRELIEPMSKEEKENMVKELTKEMTEEQKATRIEELNKSIKKLINIIDNYTEVERKIFTALREAFSEDGSRFYCIVPFIRLKERFKMLVIIL